MKRKKNTDGYYEVIKQYKYSKNSIMSLGQMLRSKGEHKNFIETETITVKQNKISVFTYFFA